MTWKIKILNIKSKEHDFLNIHVYFAIFKLNAITNEFEEFFKSQESVLASGLTGKSKNQQDTFIKDFIKTKVQPLIDTFEANEALKDLIGYEETL